MWIHCWFVYVGVQSELKTVLKTIKNRKFLGVKNCDFTTHEKSGSENVFFKKKSYLKIHLLKSDLTCTIKNSHEG